MESNSSSWSKLTATLIGTLCVVGVVAAWVIEAELLQSMQSSPNENYNKPFFLAWIVNIGYFSFFPVWGLTRYLQCRKNPRKKFFGKTEKRLTLVALVISVPYIICGWAWYYSLDRTSVSGNTIIFDSSFVWIFVLSIFVVNEKVSVVKVISLLISGGGLIIVTLSGDNDPEEGINQTIGGYVTVIFSTMIYAVYTVIFMKYTPHEKDQDEGYESTSDSEYSSSAYYTSDNDRDSDYENVPLIEGEKVETSGGEEEITTMDSLFFLGMAGVFMMGLMWPMIFVLNWTGLETFQMPDQFQWEQILANAFLDATVNLLVLIGMAWTSALFISTGCLLSMPASVMTDVILHNYLLPPVAFAGMIYVFAGFALLTISDFLIDFRERGRYDAMPHSLWKTTLITLSEYWCLKPTTPATPKPIN